MTRGPAVGGRVRVCARECDTCVFRAGNLMRLRLGRLRGMVDEARAAESAIVCHETLAGDRAVCRGFYDRHPTQPLQIASRLGLLDQVEPPGMG